MSRDVPTDNDDDFLRAIRGSRYARVGGRQSDYRFNVKKDQSACSSIEIAEDHVADTPQR